MFLMLVHMNDVYDSEVHNYFSHLLRSAASGARSKDVQVGITLSWVFFLQVECYTYYLRELFAIHLILRMSIVPFSNS